MCDTAGALRVCVCVCLKGWVCGGVCSKGCVREILRVL